ncbi:MAG: PAS domain S-box protein [Potamolinea sp.]
MLNSIFWLALLILIFSIAQDINKSLISGLAPSISLVLFSLTYFFSRRQINSSKPIAEINFQNVNKNEQAILESDSNLIDNQFQAVFNSALDAMVIVNDEGKFIDANPAACELFGLSQEELINRNLSDFTLPGVDFAEAWRSFLEQGRVKAEFRLLRADGTIRDIEYSATANILPNRHLSVLRDITARKQTEVALQASEAKIRLALEAANLGTWEVNLETGAAIWSERNKVMLGLAPGQFNEDLDSWRSQIYPDDLERVSAELANAIADLSEYDSQYRTVWADGTIHWIASIGKVLCDLSGKPVRVVGVAMDITERKQGKVALRESEERFRRAVLNAPLPMILHTEDGEVLQINRTWTQITGYSQEEIPTIAAFTEKVYQERPEFLKTDINRLYNFKQSISQGEYTLTTRQGERRIWDFYSAPLGELPDGRHITISMALDITERKQAETEKQKLVDVVQNSVEFISFSSLEGQVLFMNPAGCKLMGIENIEAARNTSILEYLASEEISRFEQQILPALLREGQWQGELLLRHFQTGATIATLFNTFLIKNIETGEPSFIGVCCFDISPRKQAEEALKLAKEQLEFRVEERTAALVQVNHQLQYQLFERQRAENRLQEITSLQQAILDAANYTIISTTVDGTILAFNAAAERLLGYTAAEVIGRITPAIIHDPKEVVQRAQELSQELEVTIEPGFEVFVAKAHRGQIEEREWTYIRKDGSTFPVLLSVTALRDTNGKITGFLGIGSDLTERKQAEEERTKLIDILEATSDFIASANLNGQLSYINSSGRKIFGLTEDEDCANFTIPKAHPNWAYEIVRDQGIPAAIRDGVWVGETAFLRHNKQEIPVSQLIIAHKSADGSVKMLSTVARDITQQKQIEATLREAERRWRSLLENVRLVVVGLDKDGIVEYVNSFFLELVGYTKEEVLSVDWFETFLPSHQKQGIKNKFIELLNQEFHKYNQNTILTKSGEERVIAWNNTLLRNLQGEAIGTLSIGEDITERQVIERMKGEFISVVSHELRTPLTSIHGALNLLSSGLIDSHSDKGRRVIDIAAESAERLVRLVNDILELERLESGRISLLKQDCNADELIVKAIDMMQVMANRAGITLSTCTQAIPLNVDPDRIIQLLTNLVGNAIKFSPKGSTVWLNVELQETEIHQRWEDEEIMRNLPQDSPYPLCSDPQPMALTPPDPRPTGRHPTVLFTVKDQGRGIPADKIESIFERFHQVDASDSRKKGGTGLGLAICRSIVQQHGGRIWVESTLGEGSSFYFTLPVADSGEG